MWRSTQCAHGLLPKHSEQLPSPWHLTHLLNLDPWPIFKHSGRKIIICAKIAQICQITETTNHPIEQIEKSKSFFWHWASAEKMYQIEQRILKCHQRNMPNQACTELPSWPLLVIITACNWGKNCWPLFKASLHIYDTICHQRKRKDCHDFTFVHSSWRNSKSSGKFFAAAPIYWWKQRQKKKLEWKI